MAREIPYSITHYSMIKDEEYRGKGIMSRRCENIERAGYLAVFDYTVRRIIISRPGPLLPKGRTVAFKVKRGCAPLKYPLPWNIDRRKRGETA